MRPCTRIYRAHTAYSYKHVPPPESKKLEKNNVLRHDCGGSRQAVGMRNFHMRVER